MSDDLSKVGVRHDTDCGLLYDDGPEVCTCRRNDDEIVKEMTSLVSLVASLQFSPGTPGSQAASMARAIESKISPQPVDEDREEAKQIAAEWYFKWEPHIDPLTAAIRRGRALERDSREG